MKRKILLAIITIAASFIAVYVVYAQEGEKPHNRRSGQCGRQEAVLPGVPNTPLDVCENKACQDWRAQIRDQLSKAGAKSRSSLISSASMASVF